MSEPGEFEMRESRYGKSYSFADSVHKEIARRAYERKDHLRQNASGTAEEAIIAGLEALRAKNE